MFSSEYCPIWPYHLLWRLSSAATWCIIVSSAGFSRQFVPWGWNRWWVTQSQAYECNATLVSLLPVGPVILRGKQTHLSGFTSVIYEHSLGSPATAATHKDVVSLTPSTRASLYESSGPLFDPVKGGASQDIRIGVSVGQYTFSFRMLAVETPGQLGV